MKIFWLINLLMPAQCEKLGLPVLPIAGWIDGLLGYICKEEVQLIVCTVSEAVSEIYSFEEAGVCYTVVPGGKDLAAQLAAVLARHNPDLIHIFGTETPHSLAMMTVADPQKTLVQIQGLLFLCAPKLTLGLPAYLQRVNPLKRLLLKRWGGDLCAHTVKRFKEGGLRELALLSKTLHIAGHTHWDHAIARQFAPQARYHHFNEILRAPFYSGAWSYGACRPYSVFVSQAMSPIKGFHMLLRVLPDIVRDFPAAHVYVAGGHPTHYAPGLPRFRVETMCEYYGYLRKTIRKRGLEEHITFLGSCGAEEMKRQYLSANVFVSCSSIENESNSLSEAKMLGVPCVASYVGGVTDRLTHGESGFFYPFNEPEILRYYIGKIFADEQLALRLSAGARAQAQITNNPRRVTADLLAIYSGIRRKEGGRA